jgi:tape measure domain-containing protein
MAIGKLNLKLGVDVSNLDKELGKVERSMSRFGSNMQNIGSTLTQSLTLPIIGLGAASLKSFADIEKLQNGLIAIMGSSEEAGIEMEKLRKVAENPGLALPEVVKASASLQSVGMNADAARETITQFGNAVARAGGGAEQFDGVVLALSQISAVGKVTQEDLNQIKERLPEFARVMKEEFGVVTAEGIRELGISSEEFIKRSVGALGNLERANGGLANTFDNLKDNVSASLAELGKAINETLNLEAVAAALSTGLQRLVDGFKSLNPETQGFIVKAGLLVAALGPAIFIVGKLISTFSALIGTTRLIMTTVKNLSTVISGAFAKILANPAILGVTLAIAAVGAIALYVYDNWKAFSDNFKNIWINIKNSVMQGVTFVLGKLDSLQKALGLDLFDLSGMTKYQEEQRVVAAEFKTIGETVDSLKGKFKSLFMATPIPKTGNGGGDTNTGDLIFGDGGAPTNGGTVGARTGGGVKSQPVNELMPTTNLLPTIGKLPDQLRSVTAETQRAKEETDAFAVAQTAAGKAIQVTDDNITRLKKGIEDLNTGFKNIIEGTLTDLSVALGEQLGNALSGAGFNIKSFLLPVAEAVISFGKLAIQVGIAALGIKTALKSLNPVIAIAGGIALVALGTLVKNSLSAPKLAEGGLAYGPTMATVGDNRNARVDPEVIAPLSKLKSMMGDMGVGGSLETRISGNDLIILLNRSQKGLSRIQ